MRFFSYFRGTDKEAAHTDRNTCTQVLFQCPVSFIQQRWEEAFTTSIRENAYHFSMRDFFTERETATRKLTNRGPIHFDDNGTPISKILNDYRKQGSYILENVIDTLICFDLFSLSRSLYRFPWSVSKAEQTVRI